MQWEGISTPPPQSLMGRGEDAEPTKPSDLSEAERERLKRQYRCAGRALGGRGSRCCNGIHRGAHPGARSSSQLLPTAGACSGTAKPSAGGASWATRARKSSWATLMMLGRQQGHMIRSWSSCGGQEVSGYWHCKVCASWAQQQAPAGGWGLITRSAGATAAAPVPSCWGPAATPACVHPILQLPGRVLAGAGWLMHAGMG